MEDYVRPFRRRKIFDLRGEEEECERIISIQIKSEREEYPIGGKFLHMRGRKDLTTNIVTYIKVCANTFEENG